MKHFSSKIMLTGMFLMMVQLTLAQYPVPLDHGIRTGGYISVWEFDSLTGKLYAGGYFENMGGAEASSIAVYDGTTWSPLGTGVNGSVRCLKMMNGILYVGGYFTDAGGVAVTNVASWDGTAWSAVGQQVTSYAIMSLEVYNSELYLSAFLSISQTPAVGIAKLTGSLWTEVATTGATSGMINLKTFNDSLHVYGAFSVLNGVPYNGYCIYGNGQFFDRSLPQAYTQANAHAVFNNRPYVISNTGRLLHLDADMWVEDVAVVDNDSKLISYGDSLYAFVSVYGSAFNPDTSIMYNVFDGTLNRVVAKTPFIWQYPPDISSHFNYNGVALITGTFFNFNNQGQAITVAFDGSSFTQSKHISAVVFGDSWWNAQVVTLHKDTVSGDVFAGGFFLIGGDSLGLNIARWDGTDWHTMGNGLNSTVRKIVMFNDTLYAAGSFTRSGSTVVNRIARWDGTGWQPVGAGANGTIYDMHIFNNALYVGGNFTTINGVTANHIARYSNGQWTQAGAAGLDERVIGLEEYGGELLAYSDLWFTIGTWPNTINAEIVSFDGSVWSEFPSGASTVQSLKNVNGVLYSFTDNSGGGVEKYNSGTWTVINSGLNLSTWPSGSLLAMDTSLILTVSNDGMYRYDGTSWSRLFNFVQAYDLVKTGPNKFILGGFFPRYFFNTGQHLLYNIGQFEISGPAATFSQDRDTLCDHQYVTYYPGFTMVPTSYEWDFPGGIPSTSTSSTPIIKYNTPGVYDVSYKISTLFGVDSVLISGAVTVLNCSLGLNDNPFDVGLHAYPNPVKDNLYINIDAPAVGYEIVDITGRVLKSVDIPQSVTSLHLDLSGYMNGIYMIRVRGESGMGSVKIIKQ
jgi:Secretion system C-terminal sorting domain